MRKETLLLIMLYSKARRNGYFRPPLIYLEKRCLVSHCLKSKQAL